MNGPRIGYIRGSTFEQNLKQQLEGVQVDLTFIDKASGKDAKHATWMICTAWFKN